MSGFYSQPPQSRYRLWNRMVNWDTPWKPIKPTTGVAARDRGIYNCHDSVTIAAAKQAVGCFAFEAIKCPITVENRLAFV